MEIIPHFYYQDGRLQQKQSLSLDLFSR